MSDYISNDQSYTIFFNRVHGNNSCPAYERYSGQFNDTIELFDEDVGLNGQGNFVDLFEGSKKCYQQRKVVGSHSAQSDGNSLSDCVDIMYIRELQRISSSLKRLLSESGQKELKVKTSEGVSQRPQPQRRSKHLGDSGHTRCRRPKRPIAIQFGRYVDTDTYRMGGISVKNADNDPVGGNSTRTTLSYKDDYPICLFPQTDTTTPFTNEVSGNVFSAQYSDTTKQDTLIEIETERRKKDTNFKDIYWPLSQDSDSEWTGVEDEVHININQVEKRRRSLIDDEITNPGNLPPAHTGCASFKTKDSILNESVDNIKKVRTDKDRVHQLEDKMSETYLDVKKLNLRIEQLETRMTTKLANSGETSEDTLTNNNMTQRLFTDQQHPVPGLKEYWYNIPTTISEEKGSDELWNDISSTLKLDSVKALPCNIEKDINDMDCYI